MTRYFILASRLKNHMRENTSLEVDLALWFVSPWRQIVLGKSTWKDERRHELFISQFWQDNSTVFPCRPSWQVDVASYITRNVNRMGLWNRLDAMRYRFVLSSGMAPKRLRSWPVNKPECAAVVRHSFLCDRHSPSHSQTLLIRESRIQSEPERLHLRLYEADAVHRARAQAWA